MKLYIIAVTAYILTLTGCHACKVCIDLISAAVATLPSCYILKFAFKAVLRLVIVLVCSYTANTLKTQYRADTLKLRLYYNGIHGQTDTDTERQPGGLPLLALTKKGC